MAPSGVRVNAITVGGTMTDTQVEMMKVLGIEGVDSAAFSKLQPLGGFCSMEDIGKVVTFLASDLSAAMTGTCLPVDRGFSLVSPALPDETMEHMKNMGDMNPMPTQQRMEQMKAMAQAKKDGNKPSES